MIAKYHLILHRRKSGQTPLIVGILVQGCQRTKRKIMVLINPRNLFEYHLKQLLWKGTIDSPHKEKVLWSIVVKVCTSKDLIFHIVDLYSHCFIH